jgi:superfamily II DNA or RNA helicase
MSKAEIQAQAMKAILPHERAGVHMSMGTGKTRLGLSYIKEIGKKALVVVPRTAIKTSWIDEMRLKAFQDLDVTFTTYRSLLKHNPSDYGCLVLDEAHNLKETGLPFMSAFTGNILGMTGTPPKFRNGEQYRMMETYYPIRYIYDLNKALEDSLLNEVNIYLWGIELSTEKNITTLSGKMTTEVNMYNFLTKRINDLEAEIEQFKMLGNMQHAAVAYKDLKGLRITRLSKMKKFLSKDILLKKVINYIPQNEKVLVFATSQEQCSRMFRYYHTSKNTATENKRILDQFKNGEIRILSAIEQISEGINIPDLKNIVICHSYASEQKPLQKIGRALRLNPDQTASVHILYYKGTVDEEWVKSGLQSIDESRITYL